MSWFSSFINPGGAYKKAGEAEQAGYDTAQGIYKPYMNKGDQAGNSLQDMMTRLMNPGGLQDDWASNYSTSPYAKQMQSEAQSGGLDAASAMGLGGSSSAVSNIQKGSANIMQQDRQNYMDDMMKKYMAAMGIGENMYNTGAGIAGKAGEDAMNHGMWQGQNTYNQNSAGGNMFGKMAGTAGGLVAGGLTGGAGLPLFGGMTSGMFGGS